MSVAEVEQSRLEAQALLLALDEADELDRCDEHPAWLLDQVACIDATSGETFKFQLLNPTDPWYWQREVLDGWIGASKSIILKARQLGITWLAAGYALWLVLYRPGTKALVISINEEEAAKVINRIWDMYLSLPDHLKNGVTVIKPAKNSRPNLHIEFRHKTGQISYVTGLPSTKKAGHGETAALVILDEFARHEYARDSWKALVPTTSAGGKLIAISTGNGISVTTPNGDTSGNFFHSLWASDEESKLYKRFLRWDLHPDRDERWYANVAMSITNQSDRAEQFPANELDAFILTGAPYFDIDALSWYMQDGIQDPEFRCSFDKATFDTARLVKQDLGPIRVFQKPQAGAKYALAADVASGRGADYSAAYVLDLKDMRICASFHAKMDADQYAYQLHYLGKWFNTAWLAIEMGGGWGEPVVLSLRDGREGRPAYPNMYLHRQLDRGDQPMAKPYGFPMNMKTRATVVEGLGEAIRERAIPVVELELLRELQTFVHRPHGPSPRAQDGCHDDRVLALAIAVEMFRQRGSAPERDQRRAKRVKKQYVNPYPWN